ncbi:MAG: primosomal protein N' [Lachnospiraceae bacterium]|nr:primosomal protein N' [Lachnospiraceae bacterium]
MADQNGRGQKYALVIIDISHEKVDRPFTYLVPDELSGSLEIGSCVKVPFGKGNKLRSGYIIGFTSDPGFDSEKIKAIDSVSGDKSIIENRYIMLAAWMKSRYGSTMINALKSVLPVKRKVRRGKNSAMRNPVKAEDVADSVKAAKGEIVLSDEQKAIVSDFLKGYDEGDRQSALLFGNTGSGKTEVYIKIIDGMLKRGRQVIMLIPEISLTYQMVRRFYQHFGDEVSIINSRLSAGEKYDQIERVKQGEVRIMIGPRSALFTPFEDLGLVIIDEEHETGYKSELMPRYHAREVAQELCRLSGARLLLGSATPSVESFYKAKKGEYRLYRLSSRFGDAQLPKVEVADMRAELAGGNFTIFSGTLKKAMDDRLARGEQIMLFLNRRGVSGFVSCKSCGMVMKCPHCDVSLTEHSGRMICHYCGYSTDKISVCPECGSKYVYGFKAGTQQVEKALVGMYPKARVIRMDADSTRKKDDYDRLLGAFSKGGADILIGTQMIVKGHDFPNVTLVGILAADQSLFESDFNAPERTFQLLVQASGRAGRAGKEGLAVIQTYRPEHFAIRYAAAADYEGFYGEEIGDRGLLSFPPVCHLMAVMIQGADEEKTGIYARWLAKSLRSILKANDLKERVFGPAPASIGRIKDMYRLVIYIKSEDETKLSLCKDILEERIAHAGTQSEPFSVFFDLDPVTGY